MNASEQPGYVREIAPAVRTSIGRLELVLRGDRPGLEFVHRDPATALGTLDVWHEHAFVPEQHKCW